MGTVILHSDLNCFYAAVEMNDNPSLRGKPVAVCGSTEDRHGIVLAKSYPAKAYGVKTGQTNRQAQQVCPGLICVPPHYGRYLHYSRMVRKIYARYSEYIEPYGMDENWIALTECRFPETDGLAIAEEIRRAVRLETGLTVSIGVSFTKVFAKLGSDMKKPDAITVICRENFREKIWPLAVSELLYVGPATHRRLNRINIKTIGDLANCEEWVLRARLGKNGLMLRDFANGTDGAPVMPRDYEMPVKSVGHGTTCVTDLEDECSVWRVLYALAQDVEHRLKRDGFLVRAVQLTVKDKDLAWQQYQMPLGSPTRHALDLALAAFSLFRLNYTWIKPVRALTISGLETVRDNLPVQLDLFGDPERREKIRTLDDVIDELKDRFGTHIVQPASLLGELYMAKDKCETVKMPGMMLR